MSPEKVLWLWKSHRPRLGQERNFFYVDFSSLSAKRKTRKVDYQSELISGNPFSEPMKDKRGADSQCLWGSAQELQFLRSVHRLIPKCTCTGEYEWRDVWLWRTVARVWIRYTRFSIPGRGCCIGTGGSVLPACWASCRTGMLHSGHTFLTSNHLMRHLRKEKQRVHVRARQRWMKGNRNCKVDSRISFKVTTLASTWGQTPPVSASA